MPGIGNALGSGSGASINEFLDNTSTEPVDVVYVITPEVNGCPGTPMNLTVTVNPTAVVNSVNFINVCDNAPMGYTITSSTVDPGLVFNWSRAVVAGIDEPAGPDQETPSTNRWTIPQWNPSMWSISLCLSSMVAMVHRSH